jgi:hypothetical protein
MMRQPSTKADKRLLGTWQSDARRTVREWRFSKRLSPRKRQDFLAIFGTLRLTYTRTRIRGVMGDYRFVQPYRVLATDSDTVALRYDDTQVTRQWRIQHIHFYGQGRYWISFGPNREWFRKVNKRGPNH